MTMRTRRWLACASFALMLATVPLVLAVAGWHSLLGKEIGPGRPDLFLTG
jgi:hypothetical protein